MKALLRKYISETEFEDEIVTLPDDYDGDPFGETVPFVMASNWQIVPLEDINLAPGLLDVLSSPSLSDGVANFDAETFEE